MKKYFVQYRAFFVFLLKFFGSYLLLALAYHGYLSQFDKNKPDGITEFVAGQTNSLLQFFGKNSAIAVHESEPCVKLFLDNVYLARIIEGCNAVSVMILFVAFVIAFKGKLKTTLLYIVSGVVIIHLLNILRISLLVIALKNYPEYEHLLHGVIFPLFIYGVVFLLWVLWVQKFSDHAKAS